MSIGCDVSFKREATVYIVDVALDLRYQIDISEINFSQSFQQDSYSVKSIQTANMFDQAVINKANPASFEITLPAIREDDLRILFDKALTVGSFDIYVATLGGIYYIETAVITNVNFVIEKFKPLTLSIRGEATKILPAFSLEGTAVPRDINRTYNRVTSVGLLLNGSTELNDALNTITMELQNEVEWVPYTHVNGAISTTDRDNSMFPERYVVKKRIISGSFTKYLLETEVSDLFVWNRNAGLLITAGQDSYGFSLNMQNCAYTNRLGTGDVFTQSYDWRMTQNPTELSDILEYITL